MHTVHRMFIGNEFVKLSQNFINFLLQDLFPCVEEKSFVRTVRNFFAESLSSLQKSTDVAFKKKKKQKKFFKKMFCLKKISKVIF